MCKLGGRDHNATSYSTETLSLKSKSRRGRNRRDHNATSYSTETNTLVVRLLEFRCRDHNATSYSTETDERAGTQRTARMQRS